MPRFREPRRDHAAARAGADDDIVVSCRRLRASASERLEELDQRALVVVAERRLRAERLLVVAEIGGVVELGGPEVMAAIDDEVGALQQLQHRPAELRAPFEQRRVVGVGIERGQGGCDLEVQAAAAAASCSSRGRPNIGNVDRAAARWRQG